VCPGGGPGVYPSINAALSALDSQGPNSITVAGTCTENIFLDKRERLVIQAAPGQTATIVAADPSAIVLQTFGSQGVVLSSLVFQGGGVIVNQGSNVSMLNCRESTGVGPIQRRKDRHHCRCRRSDSCCGDCSWGLSSGVLLRPDTALSEESRRIQARNV